jgi:hypothetical protein
MQITGYNTQDFLEQLAAHPHATLEFALNGQTLVPRGYHVTEVKAVLVEAMDCGGQADTWRETVVQLADGSREDAARGFMSVEKFLSIYGKVAAAVPVRGTAELRFEYGNAARGAMQFFVGDIARSGDHVAVTLLEPGVTCKANDRSAATNTDGCGCGPSGCGPQVMNLEDQARLKVVGAAR